ncbi:MAG: aminopeptidase [Lachnospiraceae bacterium]|nr:aminopeptidase [Lachnospiraceae bacterium]
MDYRELWKEENQAVLERYQLSMERIRQIPEEGLAEKAFQEYFISVAGFISRIGDLTEEIHRAGVRGYVYSRSLSELAEENRRLYEDILPEHYEESYANPAYAVKKLGEEYGRLLAFLYTEIRGQIVFAFESRLWNITVLNETFIEVYNLFEEQIPGAQAIQDVLYWFVSDYADQTVAYRVREGIDPSLSFGRDIIMEEDFSDLRYLYCFGEYISDAELEIAGFLNGLPQETIDKMADTYTEGFEKGFQVMGRDLSIKKNIAVRYELGYERMIKKAVFNFRAMDKEVILFRAAVEAINRNPNRKLGFHGTSPNRQYDYDHRYDSALYMGTALKERKLSVIRGTLEEYKELARLYAGPAVVETFGEEDFTPVNKKEAFALNRHQEEVTIAYSNEYMEILDQYQPGDETSFTIIAFPKPEIGEDFREIFEETIRINTLDYELYRDMQQVIIDTLDKAEYVTVKGRGKNSTDIRVHLHPLADPASQTNFENCVADVNIPVGEVFTSPMLSGTEGKLFVGRVYIGDIRFKNLWITFENGRVKDYGCENFDREEENKALIKQVIMKNHDNLPLGEFAIGTNTTAYAMAERFGIIHKLPILIVEKMGPHFAVGDTCYSWSEDAPMYNPDGKEMIARDNEISILRKTDVSKAYFSCHCDITIPYDELGEITAVAADGSRTVIIENGRFVLAGVEKLNEPLQEDTPSQGLQK